MNQPHERPPTSMRILMVTPNLPPITCGVADHTIKLGRAMIQQGAQVVVLGKHWRDPSPDMPKEFQAFLRWDGSIGSLMKIVSEGDFHWIWLQITPYAFSPRFGAPAKLILGLYRIRRRHPTLRIATCIHETHYLPEWLGKFKHIISFLQETAFTVLTGLSDLVIPSARLWEEYCRVCYHVPEDRNRYLPIAANIPHLQPDPGTRARMRQEWGLQPNQKAAIALACGGHRWRLSNVYNPP
ncbi:MAG TPA: hypothetical protein HPQ00_04490 [Magnetococcales bacterium]|nr:hypothetical protein [Magnetococcales bacterium]